MSDTPIVGKITFGPVTEQRTSTVVIGETDKQRADRLERELAALRERLAEAERLNSEARPLIEEAHRECVANRELAKQAEQRAERAEALAEQNAKDAERLDWIESQWADGIHVEVCAVGIGDERIEREAAVYTSRPNRQYQLGTIRDAIDAARSAK